MRYFAAVEVFAKELLEILDPLVAVELEEYHQPLGFSNVTLVRESQSRNA